MPPVAELPPVLLRLTLENWHGTSMKMYPRSPARPVLIDYLNSIASLSSWVYGGVALTHTTAHCNEGMGIEIALKVHGLSTGAHTSIAVVCVLLFNNCNRCLHEQ